MSKYKDELLDDIESAISSRCKHYLDKMDALLVKYEVGDDWVSLPESQLKIYHNCSLIVGELQALLRRIKYIAIGNMIDEKEAANEYDAQTLVDMGR